MSLPMAVVLVAMVVQRADQVIEHLLAEEPGPDCGKHVIAVQMIPDARIAIGGSVMCSGDASGKKLAACFS
ncbi:hypothetical protein LX36DRAFT_657714 [Colletotrichum falcatum]|nr:hypothetical protein LX36DRAFT_657714 [Colletotrichum falcatum]